MKDNLRIKRSLVIQSFAPLFLLLTIKYMNMSLYWSLICKFFSEIKQSGVSTIIKAYRHPTFGGLFIFILGLVWLIITISITFGFKGIQNSGFKSCGERITIAKNETEGSAMFMVTYVIPLLTDDVSSIHGLVAFILMLAMIITLLINSKTFYNNPILTVLKYKIYSFKFIYPDTDIVDPNAEYICITRGEKISTEATIKRKHISDGVFLIYNA